MKIRESSLLDRPLIESVHMQAFGEQQGGEIAGLVHDLFGDPTAQPLLSLVCVEGEQITGHILFSKAVVTQSPEPVNARILAPLAVVPEARGRGRGGNLVQEGLRQLQQSQVELVFVLGHPGYYPRFGFTPAGALGFEAPYPMPDEHAAAWMVQELCPGIIGSVRGTVQCSDVLNKPEHWKE
jgi:predicted N-acetyltransferase YhbS